MLLLPDPAARSTRCLVTAMTRRAGPPRSDLWCRPSAAPAAHQVVCKFSVLARRIAGTAGPPAPSRRAMLAPHRPGPTRPWAMAPAGESWPFI